MKREKADKKELEKYATTAHCGNDYIDLIIQRRCSVTCSPKEATVMPGNSQTFYASVSGWSGAINWSDSGATECVESASPVSGDSHTIKTKQVGDCIMKLITVKADTACCGSDTCKLFISRPGWIETNP